MRKLLTFFILVSILIAISIQSNATVKTLPVTQVWQHKDTNMWCVICGAGVAHPVHSPGCNHCDMYCAPASLSMFALYAGRGVPFTQQDDIYDNGKSMQGEITGNGTIETHGVGMYCGIGATAPEIQAAFTYAMGFGPFQFGPGGSGNPMLDISLAEKYIDCNLIILWIDIGKWPADMEVPQDLYYDSGHCKIIAGYDDNDTPADLSDDEFYIFDPWPTSGSPYWMLATSVIDQVDIYLTTTNPESSTEPASWGKIKGEFK